MSEKTTNIYITNKELHPELRKFKETGKMSEELGEMVMTMCKNMLFRGNFRNYTYKDLMMSEAYTNILKYLHNFDIDHPKANGFSYISSCIYNSYRNCIKKQQRHSRLKDKLYKVRLELVEKTGYNLKAIDYEQLNKD